MTINVRIDCIEKDDRFSPYEAIQFVGGPQPSGNGRWRLSLQDAINGIEQGKWSFYVHKNGHTVRVVVAVSAKGNKYLKTEADGDQPDNLLSLMTCPRS